LFLSEKARELYGKFKLSPEKTAVIVGSLFGDASLLVSAKDHVPNLYENHALRQLEYLRWKASVLGAPSGVKLRRMTHGYSRGKMVAYFQVRSRAFLDLEKMFYTIREDGRRKKIVTEEALELLVGSALAMAVLHMDDGEYSAFSNQVILSTCDFSTRENAAMADRMSSLLEAPVRVKMKRERYPRLALSGKATDKFIEIVKPYIHPTLLYKIDQDIAHHLDNRIVEKLKEEYGKRPARAIADEMDLTFSEVLVIASRLGLSRHRQYVRYRDKPFSDEERTYVAMNYGRIPTREIAQRLGTSTGCVSMIAYRLRQRKRIQTAGEVR